MNGTQTLGDERLSLLIFPSERIQKLGSDKEAQHVIYVLELTF